MPALSNHRHERFYVYVVRIGGKTRYVGKGCGRRASIHLTKSHNPVVRAEVAAANATGTPVRVRVIRSGLSDTQAFRLERRAIAKWAGRLANVAMGCHTEAERLAMECRANLQVLKTEDDVRREGSYRGVSVDRRVELLRQIRADLIRFSQAA